MTLAAAFEITPEERARLEAAPFRGTDEHGWCAFALGIQAQVLNAYAEGEIKLERALEAVLSCSLGCHPATRAVLLAGTALRAIQNPPRAPKKHYPNPTWVKYSAAHVVQMLHEDRPKEPLAPTQHNSHTTPILDDALCWLETLGLCKGITARTLYDWYVEARKAGALEPASP
jgi:hypothetical protein